ncbi:hypothetical protein D1178_14430 [Stenotrophomonas maltophilia]|nr:hypothetical protein D1178_14430 [Stenotrophomonas maltophilia]
MIRPCPLMLGEWGPAGLRPAPGVVPAAGRQPQRQQPISCVEAGSVPRPAGVRSRCRATGSDPTPDHFAVLRRTQ